MGFLSNFATGVATGVAKQGVLDYEQSANDFDTLMKLRQQAVDRVASRQAAMDADAEKANAGIQVYQSRYGIPFDQAYSLWKDPSFQKMTDEDAKQSYVNRMYSTGQITRGQPVGPSSTDQSAYQVNRGMMGGGKFTIPAVPGVGPKANYPETRDIQSYGLRPAPINPKEYGTYPAPTTPEQGAAQQRVDAAFRQGNSADPKDLQLAYQGKGGMTQNEVAARNATAFEAAAKAVHDGTINSDKFYEYYTNAGGRDPNVKNFDVNQVLVKSPKDPVFQAEIDEMTKTLGIPRELAVKIKLGILKPMLDPTGAFHGTYDLSTGQLTPPGQSIPLTKGGSSGVISDPSVTQLGQNNTNSSTPQSGTVPQNNTNSSTPQDKPLPSNGIYPPLPLKTIDVNNQPIMPKEELTKTQERMSEVPKMIAELNYTMALAKNDPNAIGIWGAVVKHFGGPAVNLANLVSEKLGDNIDNLLQVSNRKGLSTDLSINLANMLKPILSQYNPTNASGLGIGPKGVLEGLEEAFEHGTYHDTFQGLANSLNEVKNNMLSSYVVDFNKVRMPDDISTVYAKNQVQYWLRSQGFKDEDGQTIIRKTMQMRSGAGPQNG